MQTLAILQDTIRALRSRYLFWISLGISLVAAVALFGIVGFNEKGWRILWFDTVENATYRAGTSASRDVIAWIFNEIYVRWWLSWGAIVLALISTASLVPDFLASGAIELSLSKPISRLKLLGLKIGGALLFVAAQVTAGVTLAYLLMGLRVGFWLPVVFWAIPLITLQFLYLYSISALVGVLTRSTLASLLTTLIFWGAFSVIQFSANQFTSNVAGMDAAAARLQERADGIRAGAESEGRELTVMERGRLSSYQGERDSYASLADTLRPWLARTEAFELILPKTADIQKILANKAQAPVLNELMAGSRTVRQSMRTATGTSDDEEINLMLESGVAGKRAARQVDPARSILSSLIVPVAALVAAGVIFLGRDY